MNYCRRCHSDYDRPGTCNCFAPVPPREAAPVVIPCPLPVYPQPYPYPFPGTIYIGDLPAASGTTVTIKPVAGDYISFDSAIKSSAGWSFTAYPA